MLHGHIDAISAERVGGWVVDSGAPDRRVEISIFVDQRKVAQVACDRDRSDLRDTGKHGDGKHGFLYRFDPPLNTDAERHVTVRLANEGTQVANGRCVLSSAGARFVSAPATLRPEQSMRLPGPLNPRQVFDILALYDEHHELYDLLTNVDFPTDSVRDLNYCAFGSYPEAGSDLPSAQAGNPRDAMNDILISERFQREIIPIFLDAYREKRRLLFVHIPKCAGSDLSFHLTKRYPSIGLRLSESAWTSRIEFFACLRDLILRTRFSDSIFVRGHISLTQYISYGLIRPGDKVFTILRDPVEVPISQINYILTRLWRNLHREEPDPDARLWLDVLGIKSLPDAPDEQLACELAKKIMRDKRLVPPNPLCQWLGGGSAAAVVERLAAYDVELTDTTRYGTWLREKWTIESHTRSNASNAFISTATLSREDIDYIRNLSQEDMGLYRIVHDRLSASGGSSLTGRELA